VRSFAIILAVSLVTVAGCGGSGGPGGTSAPGDYQGTWILVSGEVDGAPLPIAGRVDLTIDQGSVGGTAACNHYGGEVAIRGDRFELRDGLAQTEMWCEPAELMETESAYLAALARVTTIARDGDQLTLSGDGVTLTFEVVPPIDPEALVGTTWVLDTLVTGEAASSVMGDPATLLLKDDGVFEGSTGCREFSGRYQATGDTITATDLVTNDNACPPDLEAQDAHVLEVLGDGFTTEIEGNRLWVHSRRGDNGLGYLASE
jgi:heat shock protein HslJ